MKGKLISFESGEGAGTSTHIGLLETYLIGHGYRIIKQEPDSPPIHVLLKKEEPSDEKRIVITREPGGIPVCEKIRVEIQHPNKKGLHTPEGELILYSASRYILVSNVIMPALEKGINVLTDRYLDSSIVYQGKAGGVDRKYLDRVQWSATRGIMPDLTLIIDIETKLGLSKSDHSEFGEPDSMESKGLVFHEKVRQGYLELEDEYPERVKVITYRDGDIDGMQQEVRSYVDEVLSLNRTKDKGLTGLVNQWE